VASAMQITNTGTGPALVVNQTGAQPIANFQDDGSSALYLADGGNIGIGNTAPEYKLHVTGVITATGGNSNQWNSNYTTTNTASANWQNTYNIVNSNSGSWNASDYIGNNMILLSAVTITDSLSVNNSINTTSLSATVLNFNTFYNTAGALANIYLTVNVAGSSLKIPLHYF
jgi:hypothetical protein